MDRHPTTRRRDPDVKTHNFEFNNTNQSIDKAVMDVINSMHGYAEQSRTQADSATQRRRERIASIEDVYTRHLAESE